MTSIESLTVQAGSFDTFVISGDVESRWRSGTPSQFEQTIWYAKKLGLVAKFLETKAGDRRADYELVRVAYSAEATPELYAEETREVPGEYTARPVGTIAEYSSLRMKFVSAAEYAAHRRIFVAQDEVCLGGGIRCRC